MHGAHGAGASYGRWPMPWSEEERKDSAEILTWITRQPWSNSQVGACIPRPLPHGGRHFAQLKLDSHGVLRGCAAKESVPAHACIQDPQHAAAWSKMVVYQGMAAAGHVSMLLPGSPMRHLPTWHAVQVVLSGTSYEATAALFTVALHHPAVVGCLAQYPFWYGCLESCPSSAHSGKSCTSG